MKSTFRKKLKVAYCINPNVEYCNECAICKNTDLLLDEFVKELKEDIHSTLTKLGVRIHEEDNFDLIGVNNAIYSVKSEIDKIIGDKL